MAVNVGDHRCTFTPGRHCRLQSKAAKVGVSTCGSQSGSDRWRSNLVEFTVRIR